MPRDPQSLRKPPTSSFVRRNDFLFWLAIIWLVGWAIAMVGTPLLQPIPAAPQILADPPPAAPKKASEMEQAVVQAFSKRGMHGVLSKRSAHCDARQSRRPGHRRHRWA